jgi:leucyl-tRNA synthetase
MGYGTGAIMAVPAHDSRDFAFARHFNLPITQVVAKPGEEPSDASQWTESFDAKEGVMVNSEFLNGLTVKEAIATMIAKVEEMGIGKGKTNYRLRDAIFSRQRYWGEPFPIYYKDGMPYALDESQLPLELPSIDAYKPTETGEPPLARAKNWTTEEGYRLETNTMPGFAGSSAYYLRYMDPQNNNEFISKEANNYWEQVDLYIGGAEHGTGHLIYSRFWNKFLFDLGVICKDEPFKKMINQGMIQGRTSFVYRVNVQKFKEYFTNKEMPFDVETLGTSNLFVSKNIEGREYYSDPIRVDISMVHNDILDTEEFNQWRDDLKDSKFIFEQDKEGNPIYVCGWEVEKMSKSKFNVQNPDDLVAKYGADTLRLYEMFLGPLEQSKPWDTQGIEGVYRFIRKFWRLYTDENNEFSFSDEPATKEELKSLHKLIKKEEDDIERISFNTVVSAFMICVNELTDLKCNKREILEPLAIMVSPYAPHLAEELWHQMGHDDSVVTQKFPEFVESYVVENNFTYPVSINGKKRFDLELPITLSPAEIEKAAIETPEATKWIADKSIKKVVVVPKKIINIVIG